MENKNKEHFTTDSIFPQVSELRASEVKITDHGRLQLVMKDEVSNPCTSHSAGHWSVREWRWRLVVDVNRDP